MSSVFKNLYTTNYVEPTKDFRSFAKNIFESKNNDPILLTLCS